MFHEITRFVNWLRRRNPTADTAKSYRYHLRKFTQIVGDSPPREVTLHDIDAFIEFQAGCGLKSSSINRSLTAVASFYHFLADEDPSIECPVLRHRHLLRDHQRLPRAVPRGEVEKLFAVMDDGHFDAAQCKRDRAIFLLMLRSGLRVSEVAGLTLPDLFLEERPPRLHIHGKNGRERAIYLSAETVTALSYYLDERPPVLHALVFLTYTGQGIGVRGIQKRLQQYRQVPGCS